ncbi:unnamed protein product [Symbiodinium sp. CCMP2592]|nr:unnamed protein product [Symbiodinium sp. CCMP2592]
MAMERFLARASGFVNKTDVTLDELDLGWLARIRLGFQISAIGRQQHYEGSGELELSQQTFRSLSFLCDASPKAFKELWCPIVATNDLAVPWVVQRLSDLLATTADTSSKLEAAQEIADGLAGKMIDDSRARAKQPKSLSKLQQARLATREQVQAVLHSLELLDVELKPGNVGYPSANPKEGTQRRCHDGKPFMYDVNKGEAVWLELEDDDRVRIILNPDEGSALFAGFQFLANLKLPVAFRRDELHKLSNHFRRVFNALPDDTLQQLFGAAVLEENGFSPSGDERLDFDRRAFSKFHQGRWLSWGFSAQSFTRKYTATLLAVLWTGMEEGRNPFVEQKNDRSYDRVLDLCVKAGSTGTPQRSVQCSVVRPCWMKRLTACFSPWRKW